MWCETIGGDYVQLERLDRVADGSCQRAEEVEGLPGSRKSFNKSLTESHRISHVLSRIEYGNQLGKDKKS